MLRFEFFKLEKLSPKPSVQCDKTEKPKSLHVSANNFSEKI